MRRFVRAALVIARRDYAATVFSRTFLVFLLGPLLPLIFAGVFGALDARDETAPARPPLVVQADAASAQLLQAARTRIADRLGEDWLPPLRIGHPHPGSAVLTGTFDRPELTGPHAMVVALRGPVALLVDQARASRGAAPAPVRLALHVMPDRPYDGTEARRSLARIAQLVAFVLTMILAGMLMFNLVEEKSSKVIEVLSAAAPIGAIFAGKLAGMLAVSLTAITVWGGSAAIVAMLLAHTALLAPAIGWIPFAALAAAYWILLYLLTGAVYLGVGAQAGGVREVQSLSLPLTFAQLAFFGLGQVAAGHPESGIGLVATLVPWSAPYAMLARAVEQPAIWPHALALLWLIAWLVLVVRLAARLFRRNVLRSGGTPKG